MRKYSKIERAKAILNNELLFDRTYECDFCGNKEIVALCNYGTSHYNRLICSECANQIIEWNKKINGNNKTYWYNEETERNAKKTIESEMK